MRRSSKIAAIFAAAVLTATAVPAAAFAQDIQSVTAEAEAPGAKKDISKCVVGDIPDAIYWGDEVKPLIQVYKKKYDLGYGELAYEDEVSSKNYTVTYKNNNGIGTATAIITGKGSYTGTLKVKYKIVPPNTCFKTISAENGKVSLSWDKVSRASKYYVYCSTNGGDFKKLAVTKKCKYSTTKLDVLNNTYAFYIGPAKTVNKKTYINKYGESNLSDQAFVQLQEKSEFDGVKFSGVVSEDGAKATITVTGFDFAKYMKKATSEKPYSVVFYACGTEEFWSMNSFSVLFDNNGVRRCNYSNTDLEYTFDKATNTLTMTIEPGSYSIDELKELNHMYLKLVKFSDEVNYSTLATVANFQSGLSFVMYGGYANMTIEWK